MKTRERWEFKGNVRKEGERKELASEKLHSSEYMQSYMRKMEELLGGAKVGIGDSFPVSEVSEIFKKSLIQGLGRSSRLQDVLQRKERDCMVHAGNKDNS